MKTNIAISQATFNFNPFGGLNDQEILKVIVPKFNFETLIELLDSKEQLIVEFVGKKGRGKTLHLRCLQLLLNKYPAFYLDKGAQLQEILPYQFFEKRTSKFIQLWHSIFYNFWKFYAAICCFRIWTFMECLFWNCLCDFLFDK